jgi:predicted DsbA family dithiol-disulfide isomerase
LKKLKIDIWSDVMCPFCYIGKRKFEQALAQFEYREDVEIEWHSFQLDPNTENNTGLSVYDYLAERKGMSREQSIDMHKHVTNTAKRVGLEYNFDIAKIANSFDAHRFVQYAKTNGVGDAAEEALFSSYFTHGKDISDHQTLAELGVTMGLDKQAVLEMLAGEEFRDAVVRDIKAAEMMGINGVPFFVLDEKYGVSGAQSPELFLNALQTTWEEAQAETIVGDKNQHSS